MFGIGPPELLVILILALIVFGPKRLPEIGRTVGKGLREFRQASQDIRGEIEGAFQEERPGSTPPARRPVGPDTPAGPDVEDGQGPGGDRDSPASADGHPS